MNPPLQVGDLLEAAAEKAGSDAYGDDWFHEPLSVLVDGLNTGARLSEQGFALTRRRLVALLVDRLRLRELQARDPSVLEERVDVAGVICGLPRTGSTLLYGLLAASPRHTATLSWECSFPIPFPGEGPESPERKRRARAQQEAFLALSPDFAGIHTVTWDGVEEDVLLLDRTFVSMGFESFYRIPSYGDWLRTTARGGAHDRAYAELREWLQVLQRYGAPRAGGRWILKSPHHLIAVPSVLGAFPEARIVMTHRSPVSAVPSYASMVATMSAQYSDDVDRTELGPYWSRRFAGALRDFTAVREARPGRFVDVGYDALVAAPVEEARRVLGALGEPGELGGLGEPGEAGERAGADSGAELAAYLRRNREERRGERHGYTPEEFGLTRAALEQDFASYVQAFNAEVGA